MTQFETQTRIEEFREDIVADSLVALELPGVLEEVAQHAASEPGRAAVLESEPAADLATVRAQLALVAELKEIVGLHGPVGLGDLLPMEGILATVANPATILDVEEILAVRDLAALSHLAMDRLSRLEERYVQVRRLGARLIALHTLEHRINDVFDDHGMVRETASRELMAIRERLRKVRRNVQNVLDDVVRNQDLAHVVQEDYVTLRNDRYVILLRPEFKGYLDGIVHDHSRSGASVYVEPLRVVELNNQVASLLDEEREEIRRIFKELTGEIRIVREELSENYRLLSRLDAFQARAKYASETDSVEPELVERGFRILGARHPLLLAAADTRVVPMDVIQVPSTSIAVISGANMGGKTVALKIAGLFPLMVRCGMMIPALEGTKVQPFARIMADIGDEQDIRTRVSSFSGHMHRIGVILATAARGDLVLLDELGSATDPEEGSALAMAIMDELIARGARVVITTHLTHLKAYALGRPEVENVSVEFHPQTMQPTFRLLYNVPGESHAIETAERIGLPEHVIAAARSYADKAAGGSSKLIERLRNEISAVELNKKALEEERGAVARELEDFRTAREGMLEGFRREAREAVRTAERRIAELQKALKTAKGKERPRVRESMAQIKADLEQGLGVPLEKQLPELSVGTRVRVGRLGKEGVVSEILEKGHAEVSVGKMKVRAAVEDLDILEPGVSTKKNTLKMEQIRVDIPLATPRGEVNVVGLRVDEALPVVDKALDDAVLGGLSSVHVIHGKGTGRLKQAIRDYLSQHALVKGIRGGDMRRGGEGVTIVDLDTE
ncbi:MAG: endonuclease MutS2 [Thermodesulfobacteriota bacterium]